MSDEKSIAEKYQEEREKMTQLPDADSDFIALQRAYERED